ncbi:MAG TPA: hypothetical protein VJ836_00785 [Candidatus Saccharimonadales bacterium]|nr:hypothetical protein [Candidatus Saccharimonadales bacterium]
MAYNLLDLTTNVQDDLKDTSFSTTRIRRYLNHGQRVIFGTHDFRFTEKSYSGTMTAGDLSITQQTDHETTIRLTLADPSDATQVLIFNEDNFLSHRDFFANYPNVSAYSNNTPSRWTEFGNKIYFNTKVDKSYNYTQHYNRVATPMTANTDVPDVPETFRELLELWADYRGEKYRGNHDIAATYKQEFEDELENMAIKFSAPTAMGPTIWRNTNRVNRRYAPYDSL